MKMSSLLFLSLALVGCENNNSHMREISPPNKPVIIVPPAPTVAPTIAPTAAPNPNLICDGSFEGIYAGNSWEVFADNDLPLNCWKIRNLNAGLEVQYTGVAAIPAHGNYLAELDSHKKYGLTSSNVEIYQVIKTVPGQPYDLTFYYAARTSNSSSNMTVAIAEVNGLNLITTISQGYSDNNNAFKKYSLKFVATSCKTHISFKGTGAEDSLGSLLDAVSLKRYEPSIDCDCN